MDMENFGLFAQRMFSAGLVFNIEFTDAELAKLPDWEMFNQKIMDGISTLPAAPELPPPPPNMPGLSVNTTLWSFVGCHCRPTRNHPGRRSLHLNPPANPITQTMFTLEELSRTLGINNPISLPGDTPVPERLLVVGKSFQYHSDRKLHLTPETVPRFTGFVTASLSSISGVTRIPNDISHFGFHACFGYHLLEGSFGDLSEVLHSVVELCGTPELPCPRRWSPPSPSPDMDTVPLPLTQILSPKLMADTIITSEDYLESEEEINEWIAKLQQEQEGRCSPGSPSVHITFSIPSFKSPQLTTPI